MNLPDRILSCPLAANIRGASVRVTVAADKYTVATISGGINDREAYAHLFAGSLDVLIAVKELGVVCDAIHVQYSDEEGKRLEAAWARLDAAIAKSEGRES